MPCIVALLTVQVPADCGYGNGSSGSSEALQRCQPIHRYRKAPCMTMHEDGQNRIWTRCDDAAMAVKPRGMMITHAIADYAAGVTPVGSCFNNFYNCSRTEESGRAGQFLNAIFAL